ncbi:MAG: hypothetical protein E7167_06045 [Firmicutes bacterium]|nr:hypothetical protein [Bacillota bacterium]
MKKKIFIAILLIVGFIAALLILLPDKKDKTLSSITPSVSNQLSILICDNEGENCDESANVPTGSYIIDEEQTYCEGGGKVGNYDASAGTIKYNVKGNDECTIYFKESINYLSQMVLAKESSRDYTSSQDGSIYRVVNQNGVRYEGKNPDNYVEFNGGELWRIIGTFNGADIGLDSTKYYTKIIKAQSTITKAQGNTLAGTYLDWVNSPANTYLNGEYYNSLTSDAQNMIAKYNDEFSTWHIRAAAEWQDFFASDWYSIERSTGTAVSVATQNAAIGLMYPSDYGYAAYGSNCNNTSTETLDNYSNNCGTVDWLSLSGENPQWLITTLYWSSSSSMSVINRAVQPLIGMERLIFPTLYLEADIVVDSGEGTSELPYILK